MEHKLFHDWSRYTTLNYNLLASKKNPARYNLLNSLSACLTWTFLCFHQKSKLKMLQAIHFIYIYIYTQIQKYWLQHNFEKHKRLFLLLKEISHLAHCNFKIFHAAKNSSVITLPGKLYLNDKYKDKCYL